MLVGAVSLTGCTTTRAIGPAVPASATGTPSHVPATLGDQPGGPMLPATTPAPEYLTGSNVAPGTPSGTLPLVNSVPSNAVSLPWGVISRDESTGAMAVAVDDGGCVSVPFGYTATAYRSTIVVITVYSTGLLPSGEACAGVGHLVRYRLTLPSADAKLALAHAPY